MKKFNFGYRKVGKVLVACAVAVATFGVANVASAEEVATASATTVEASVESVSVESMTPGTISTTTEANDVSNQAQVTGDISLSDVNSGFSNDSLTVDTTIVGSVSEGDYVDYTLHNLPLNPALANSDVSMANGEVIGRYTVVSSHYNDNYDAQNNPKPNTDLEKQALTTDTMKATSIVRVTFNHLASTLDNIRYSWSYTNVQEPHYIADKEYQYEKSVEVAGNKVISETVTVPAVYKDPIPRTHGEFGYAKVMNTGDGQNMEGTLSFGVRLTNGDSIPVGSILSYRLPDDTLVFDVSKIEVGSIKRSSTSRGYFDEAQLNADRVVLNERGYANAKVVSVTPREVVLEYTEALIASPSKTSFVFPVISNPTADQIINDGKTQHLSNTVVTLNGIDNPTEVDVQIEGVAINASGSLQRGTVVEINKTSDGLILSEISLTDGEVVVGTPYNTQEQEDTIIGADGKTYRLIKKADNSVGTVQKGRTEVVNVYEEVKSSVFEDNFIEGTTTKLTDTATVVSKASVGSAYDSSAQDEVITLADGKSYKLVSKATNSTGKVAETDTYLANYYSEIKGSVVVKYVDTAGNTIAEDIIDTEDSSTGVSYDTTDNKPTMILVKNADDTVTAYAFKEISAETSGETGKVVAGETVVTYVYEEVAIVPVKDVLNKDGESVDGGKATVGDVLTFVLDGSPISDGIQGGLWQYDLKDVLDTAKVEYIDGSVKVYAGEFANITLPDGSVLKADDDISSYVTIEYVDGVLTIKPTEKFYTILKDNGVEDLVDIDAQFDVKLIADGTIENTLIQVVKGFEFKSNKTTTEAEVPVVETPEEPKVDEPVMEAETPVVEETKQSEPLLPNTGTQNSYALSVMGVLALFGSLLGLRKKKETE
ncbi:MucBP domain-containing protein [Streptococcus suis]|uniref:MucBP domain-containing protein n=2 Tax=Streptococcus suis TaxID=1307 RepID=UPI00201A4EF3|nr:MucBP domain-containing protein [Streptococcus suis]MCL4881186.1 MucBP domain-containing protein [Streptococcus suis]